MSFKKIKQDLPSFLNSWCEAKLPEQPDFLPGVFEEAHSDQGPTDTVLWLQQGFCPTGSFPSFLSWDWALNFREASQLGIVIYKFKRMVFCELKSLEFKFHFQLRLSVSRERFCVYVQLKPHVQQIPLLNSLKCKVNLLALFKCFSINLCKHWILLITCVSCFAFWAFRKYHYTP